MKEMDLYILKPWTHFSDKYYRKEYFCLVMIESFSGDIRSLLSI